MSFDFITFKNTDTNTETILYNKKLLDPVFLSKIKHYTFRFNNGDTPYEFTSFKGSIYDFRAFPYIEYRLDRFRDMPLTKSIPTTVEEPLDVLKGIIRNEINSSERNFAKIFNKKSYDDRNTH